jgi:hypothetical protein
MPQIDSLSANEFAVYVDQHSVPGVFRVSGFVPFKLNVQPGAAKLDYAPLRLTKMVQRDPALPFNRWLRETLETKPEQPRPTRTLALVALDEGQETRRWTLRGAWISEIGYSDFNSASGELVEEIVTIHYQSIEVTWAAR